MTLEQFKESFPKKEHQEIEFVWDGETHKQTSDAALTFLLKKRSTSRAPYTLTDEENRVRQIYYQEVSDWHSKVEEWFAMIGVTFEETGEYDDRCVHMTFNGHDSIECGSLSQADS